MLRRDRVVTVDGRTVAFADLGQGGVPLILLHGAAFDHADLSWGPMMEPLAQGRRVIAPDLPGYRASAAFDAPHDLEHLGLWLVHFMTALDIAQADFAGVSMGGGMALWLARHRPDRVRRVIPIASYGLMDQVPMHMLAYATVRGRMRPLMYRFARTRPWAVRRGMAAAIANPNKIDDGLMEQMMEAVADQAEKRSFDQFLQGEINLTGLRGSLSGELGKIPHPALLIHGRRDPIVPIRHARDALDALPEAGLLELRAAHWPAREHPTRVVPVIDKFLLGSAPVWDSAVKRPASCQPGNPMSDKRTSGTKGSS